MHESGIRNQESGITNQESGIRNQESGMASCIAFCFTQFRFAVNLVSAELTNISSHFDLKGLY
jgi:hypothetical protein